MENSPRILSTKKLLPNQKQYLLSAGFSVIEADFIGIQHLEFKFDKVGEFLIFTSQNAVESVLKNKNHKSILHKRCFCVGEKTKALLEENGFVVLIYADYASELASTICNKYQKQAFTFFSGNLRRDILPEALQLAQIEFEEIPAYETIFTPIEVTSPTDGILFFSPSAVDSFTEVNSLKNQTCFCIGKTTAEAVEKYSENIVIAHQPSIENVIVQCIQYYKNKLQ
ncbi:uroporphyrinogen-III synthase [Flavobacterium sp. CYK-4]|uniref:uroporphyrinogen-III synthase n=1 Tax=Flavobacterium lotistagni TaxID=2709660 RepID=UPI00140D6227|nr:uroporphyrinogen-III synthase [Flavobacterium lotistagni]NHM07864.1 uroporphyrinogen-III synthase [Flavobacterium lotistagni]